MIEALQIPFMQRILLAGMLASLAAGIVGTFVVVKRMSSLSGGLAHAAFGGVGLGYVAGFSPLLGALIFGMASGVGVGIAYRRMGSAVDTAVSIFWSAGMAIGVVLIALAPGYAPDLTSYLFGSLLFASWQYVLMVALLDVVIVVTVLALYRPLEAVSFDEEFAEVIGLPVDRLLLLLLALTALAVVTLIQVVGVILAIALLTIPAETARTHARSLLSMMLLSAVIATACSIIGILMSYQLSESFGLSVPTGPLIILLSVVIWIAARLRQAVARRL